jgi:mono/diheme cytochrome c family protein
MSGMSRARSRNGLLPPALALLLAATGAAAGCVSGSQGGRRSEAPIESGATDTIGTAAEGNPKAGKEIFAQRCAQCHSLDPRRSDERVNLGDLRPSFDVVVEAVEDGGIVMPSFERRLSNEEIRDVAAYVTESERR